MADEVELDVFEDDLISYLARRLELEPEVVRAQLAESLLNWHQHERSEPWRRYLESR